MKKKWFGILCAVLILATIFEFSKAWEAILVNAQQNEGTKTIIIDPGHGGEDGGTTGEFNIQEKDVNLQIAVILQDLFETAGYQVVMTREGDYAIGDNSLGTIAQRKSSDIKKRVEICNTTSADFVLSIHQNHFSDSKYSGAQMFFGKAAGSKELAQAIQDSIVSNTQPQNHREIKQGESSIYLLNHVEKPIVIVECGFLSNREEAQKLMEDEYLRSIAFSIYLGGMEYLCKTPA